MSGLRLLRGGQTYQRCRHDLVIPRYGRVVLDLELDEKSQQSGYKIERRDAADGVQRRRLVELPEALGDTWQASYAVHHACANVIMMTRWEAEQRVKTPADDKERPDRWDEELVGTIVKSPVEEIVLELALPESLSSAKPYVRCERPREFPNCPIDKMTDDVEVTQQTQWDLDREMGDEEARYLSYVPESSCWRLAVHRPLVSYRYSIRWHLAGTRPAEPIPGTTEQWRELLVQVADRAEANEKLAIDGEVEPLFAELGNSLEKMLGSGNAGERRAVELFVYDSNRLAMRPVLSRRDGQPAAIPLRFEIPLGNGLAGAAFQKRLMLPWAQNADTLPFIAPVPYPGEPPDLYRTMLAVPVYHPTEQDEPRPSPWSAICVVCFGSSSLASKIPPLIPPFLSRTLTPESGTLSRAVRAVCQSNISNILNHLSGGGTGAEY